MKKLNMLYEGRAKKFYATENSDLVVVQYTDDATAFNGIKKATFVNKAVVVNKITTMIYKELEKAGIQTAYVDTINEYEQIFKKVEYIPLKFICRNIIAGSCSTNLDIPEGTKPANTIYEICYKNDYLKDPMINEHHAVALGAATYTEINEMFETTHEVNKVLKSLFESVGITLVDFKLEFGRTPEGQIVVADEISPDTARMWDAKTGEKFDKDRFRRDLGYVIAGYEEIANRLSGKVNHE